MIGTPRPVTVDILNDAGTTVHSAVTDFADTWWAEDDSDAAAFSATIPNGSTYAAACVPGNLLRFKVSGTADRTCLIENSTNTVVSVRHEDRRRVLTGRDWLAEFDDAVVDPPLGVGFKPAVNVVRFDWTHPQLDRTGWVTPTYIGSLFTGDLDPFGAPMAPPLEPKRGYHPEAWPDVFTGWIWSQDVDVDNNHPAGTSYFYLPITLAATSFLPIFTGDDRGELAFDGGVIDPGVYSPAVQWTRCSASGIDAVSAGAHHIAVKATNTTDWGWTGIDNPGAIALVGYQPSGGSQYLEYDSVVVRTGSSVGGTNPLTGGNWKCLNYPASPPGFTIGRAFRLLFEQAQAQNHLTGWTLGFTDTVDSDGNAWATTDTLTASVNDDTLLDVIRAWHDQGHWDVAASATARTLHAWRWQERGNYDTSFGSPLVWAGDNVPAVTVTEAR